jgi:hypothetical protein
MIKLLIVQKQRIATILGLLLLPAVCPAAVRTVSLAGTIDKTLNIRMELKIDSGKISGSYFYEKDKTPISLKGTMDDLGHFEIQEFDAQGKVTGTFRGEDTSIFDKRFWPHVGQDFLMEGDWTKPGSDKKLPFALQVDPVYHQGKSSGWAGDWNYTKSTQFDSGSITIGNEQPGSFDFTMGGGSGAHPCQLEGTAQISGTKASWTDSETGCKVTITLKAGKLALKTTEQCNEFCGMGAQFYNGEYRHGPVKQMDLVDLGVLKKAQQKELQRLSGKDYHLFVDSLQLLSEVEDLDGIGIKGTSGAVRGLFTEMEAIVLYRPDGKMWAAVIDAEDQTVKYFTSDPAYAGKLPKTIDKWRERFADKKVLFMSKTK